MQNKRKTSPDQRTPKSASYSSKSGPRTYSRSKSSDTPSDRPDKQDSEKRSFDRKERSARKEHPGSKVSPSADKKFDRSKSDKFSGEKNTRDGKSSFRNEGSGGTKTDRRTNPAKKSFSSKGSSTTDKDQGESFRNETLSSIDNSWRLNKYIANSGVCSRREADQLIAEGKVLVNGKTVTEMGVKVTKKDKIQVNGVLVNPEDFVYILLNKPKNHITTTDDEKDRRIVMDLIEDATGHRVYPVGRLDRNTTGLLLLTNDGDLANRLMHPSYKVRKVYEVETAQPMPDDQLNEMLRGITLEDGPAKAHSIKRIQGFPNMFQLTIFEGRNRQVRRMVEHFGHEVVKLHRSIYAGLNVRGVRNGRWRYLKPKEVNDLRTLVKLFDLKQK